LRHLLWEQDDESSNLSARTKFRGIITRMNEEKMCACGRPLHYSDPELQRKVEEIVKRQGEAIKITIGHRSWMVQRHYIALHGLSFVDVQYLNFPEVTDGVNPVGAPKQ
jgi:hypothetical protein